MKGTGDLKEEATATVASASMINRSPIHRE